MGLFDKLETGLKNVDSKATQKIDEAKYDSEIKKRRTEIERGKFDIGDAYCAAMKAGKPLPEAEMKEIYGRISALEKEAADLEGEKARMVSEAKAEREANRRATG